jgi:hypothetical protein
MTPFREAITDNKGEFTFDVPPGEYFIYAIPEKLDAGGALDPAVPVFVGTFYPDSTDLETAIALTAYEGAPLTGLRLQLQKAVLRSVRGRIEGAEDWVGDLTELNVQLRRSFGPESNLAAFEGMMPDESELVATVKKDGQFSIPRVAPGSYFAIVSLLKPRMTLVGTHLTVHNEDVDRAVLIAPPATTFSGRIAFEDAEYRGEELFLTLRGYDANGLRVFQMAVSKSGEFVSENVVPGTYRVSLSSFGPSDALYVTRTELLSKITEGGKFDLLPPGSGQVIFRVSREEAVIEGRVEGNFTPESPFQGTLSIGITPMTLTDIPTLTRALVGADGTFLRRRLEPGQYQVCAWDENRRSFGDILSNPKFKTRLDRLCKTVELEAGSREYVTLEQISISDLKR